MKIKKIKVSNFKSFESEEITFDDFNVIIGPNASGKSNFVEIFRFIKDVSRYGLENAVSMQGGIEFLKNLTIDKKEIEFELQFYNASGDVMDNKILEMRDILYKFKICFDDIEGQGYKISNEELVKTGAVFDIASTNAEEFLRKRAKMTVEEREQDCENSKKVEFRLKNENGEILVENSAEQYISSEEICPLLAMKKLIEKSNVPQNIQKNISIFPPNKLFLESAHIWKNLSELELENIAIYDFDPKLPKKAVPITGKTELEQDGSNLAIVLKQIFKNGGKDKLQGFIKDLLPAIGDIDVDKSTDKRMFFNICENQCSEKIPSCFISDGTINIISTIIALFFENNHIVIIEEPERNLHPKLMSKLAELLKDASKRKQIIITTHNPELVKYAGLDSLIFISRNESGHSQFSRPSDSEFLKLLLKEIGLDKAYIENLIKN
ncbi:putative ATPase [Methanococcus maripaludis]|uniref:Putative ATPase n=1 Tax=Methanococcus maripaludis TaxID=39152 RepID=A0A7J9S6W9_METMI|nr:AAA family ATPase [Methanococcus maripaludis]MBB6401604.1 putative ATPase [Methanococcus maripaludis]